MRQARLTSIGNCNEIEERLRPFTVVGDFIILSY